MSVLSGRSELKGRITNKTQTWFKRNKYALVVLGLIILSWSIYSRFFNPRGNQYLPSPAFTLSQSIEFRSRFFSAFFTTGAEIMLGFVLASIIGVILGILLSESFIIRQMMLPLVVYVESLSHALFAPLFILWFGQGIVGLGIYASWYGFFPVFINTLTGFTQIDQDLRNLGLALGASRWQRIKKLKLWAGLPHIASGIKIAAQQCIVGAIIGEFIAGVPGLGNILTHAFTFSQSGLMFGALIAIILFSIILLKTIFAAIEFVTPGPSS